MRRDEAEEFVALLGLSEPEDVPEEGPQFDTMAEHRGER